MVLAGGVPVLGPMDLAMTSDFSIGDRVCLASQPPYFKTADPMPMLRPPDLVAVGEVGIVTEQRLGGYWVVKFEHSTLLVDSAYIKAAETDSPTPEATS